MSCALSFYSVEDLKAQTLDWESFIENLLVDAETDSSWGNLYDDLCILHENPININVTTTEELVQLPFLTFQQIEEIEAYLYSYGPMKSLGELNLIKGLDYETRQKLKFFIYCGESVNSKDKIPSWKELIKYGKNELVLRTDVPFYELPETYLGSDLYHSIRYKYKYGDKIEAGMSAEKDMGENGIDSYSFFASLKNKGIFKRIIVGNYRLGFGQGLVLNTNFSMGKTAVLSTSSTTGKRIKPHSSTSEANYFQGIASTIELGKWDISAFFSHRNIDATLSKSSISTLKDDGYHRTELEMSKKGNTLNIVYGGNISFQHKSLQVGMTTIYTFLNRSFLENTIAYRKFYPVGNNFWNSSIDYSYKCSRLSLMGEFAISDDGGWASMNTLHLRLFSNFQLSILHRYYDKKYNTLYGSSFSENSSVKNEHGIYIGLKGLLNRKLNAMAYLDFFQFPYLKYGVSKPNTQGYDAQLELQYNSSKKFTLNVRYRNKSKQADYKENEKKGIAYTMNQKLKLQMNYVLGSSFQGKTILNFTQVNEGRMPASRGYSVSQSLQYKVRSFPLQFSVNGIYFHTDNYDSRVFSYEQGLLYSFSIASYYGEGYRFSTLLKYDITKKLSIQCKYGLTHYLDRETEKSLLNLQLRYKFP